MRSKNHLILLIINILCLVAICAGPVFGQDNKTLKEYDKIIEKHTKNNNQIEAAKYLNKAGYLSWRTGQLEEAIKYFKSSIEINEDIGNKNAIKQLNSNIGLIYTDLKEFEKSVEYLKRSITICKMLNDVSMLVNNHINIGIAYQGVGQYKNSNQHLKTALDHARENNNIKLMKTCYSSLAENYRSMGNREESYKYFELASSLNQELQKEKFEKLEQEKKQAKEESLEKETALKQKEDTLKQVRKITKEKELQIELLNKEKKLQELTIKEAKVREEARKRTIVFLSSGLVIFIFLSGIIFWQFRQKKSANKLLAKRAEKINLQKEEIEKQKKKITSSIQYARRIQSAVLPPDEEISQIIPNHFILHKPRDIVSGDFYWFTEKEGVAILAVADCTGHGVPGAFMSMLGTAYLNEIVNKIGINKHIRSLNANEILGQLRENVIKSLHQTNNTDSKDGMDVALCIIDFENHQLQFAGANNPLLLIRNNEITEIKGDRMPIGIGKHQTPFTNHELDLQKDDVIFMFSDGYVDQFGGSKGGKFLLKRFKKLLMEVHGYSFDEQKSVLEKNFNEWRGTHFQVDDVLVVGLKIAPIPSRRVLMDSIDWQNKRILIAEDTDLNYFLLVEALKKTKAQVFRAKNGKEAIEFTKKQEVDLILMDLNMPEVDGFEAVKKIRKFRKDLPIIAQTAQGQKGDKEKCLKAGCNDYLAKPVDLKVFISKLNNYLSA